MIMVIRHRRELTLGTPCSMTPARRSISYVSPVIQGTSVSKGGFDQCERGRKVYRDGIADLGHLSALPLRAELPATGVAPTTKTRSTRVQTCSVSTTGRLPAGLSAPSAAALPINTAPPIDTVIPIDTVVPSSDSPRTTKGPLSGVPAWSPPVL
jgi:hypothetical protein